MKNLEKQLNLITALLAASQVTLESCRNSSLVMVGVGSDSAATWHGMMLDSPGWPDLLPSGPDADEDADNEDYSWMDDMEAAGVSPL